MASSGSFNTSAYEGRYLTFSWKATSQSVENNSTALHWELRGAGGGSTWYMAGPFKVVIDGLTVYNSSKRRQLGNGTLVAEGNIGALGHRADGTKSFVVKVEAAVYTYSVNCSGSATVTLNTIPRKSTLTASNGTMGTAQTLTINRASSSFTHTLTYKCGSASGTIATKTTSTSLSWTPPLSLASQNTTGASVTVAFTLTTYSGNTSIGSTTKSITCSIPSSVKPSCSLTLEDTTGWDDVYGSPVQGLSNIKVTINTTLAYGSPITNYSATANGSQFLKQSFSTGVLKLSGDSEVSATVKDRRGRQGKTSYTMKALAYTKPAVTKLSVARCDQDGTANDQGEYVKAVFSAKVTALNSKNTASYKLKYKKSTASSYTTVALSSLDNVYSVSGYTYIFEASSDSSYNIVVEVADRHSTATRTTSASTAFTLINWGEDGTSMGIGKVAEKSNTLQIGMDVEFIGKVKGAIFDAIYPVGSIYLAYNHTDPATLFGGTWVRINNAFLWATDADGTIGKTGGSSEVTLTLEQIPSHHHGSVYSHHASTTKDKAWYSTSGSEIAYGPVWQGGGQPHNNMPPYIQVSAWRRTA